MNTATSIICWVVGFAFLAITFRAIHKDRVITTTTALALSAFFFLCGLPWFQGLAKTWIVSNFNSKLKSMGEQVDTVQTTVSQMQEQLAGHQKELNRIQGQIRSAQSNVLESQIDITNQYKQLSVVHSNLLTVQTNIEAQEKKISDIEYWVENLYGKMTNESFSILDKDRVTLLSLTNGAFGLIIRLKHARWRS